MNGNIMKKQVQVYYTGRVQGVGFRFTAERLAGQLGIAGRVRNLAGGRVEIVASGKESDLKDFLQRIQDYFSEYIQDVDISWIEPAGEFSGFKVQF